MKTIIHVNQHKIRAGDDNPLTVKTYKTNLPATEADILDENGKVVAQWCIAQITPCPAVPRFG